MNKLVLSLQPLMLSICRLKPFSEIPQWAINSEFFSVTQTAEELSIVCPEHGIPSGTKSENGWRALKINGPIDFALTGVLSSLLSPLADAGISIFAISTFDTDYVLIKSENVEKAVSILQRNFEINL